MFGREHIAVNQSYERNSDEIYYLTLRDHCVGLWRLRVRARRIHSSISVIARGKGACDYRSHAGRCPGAHSGSNTVAAGDRLVRAADQR